LKKAYMKAKAAHVKKLEAPGKLGRGETRRLSLRTRPEARRKVASGSSTSACHMRGRKWSIGGGGEACRKKIGGFPRGPVMSSDGRLNGQSPGRSPSWPWRKNSLPLLYVGGKIGTRNLKVGKWERHCQKRGGLVI